MSKKTKAPKVVKAAPVINTRSVLNEHEQNAIMNGLGTAVFGGGFWGPGQSLGEQLSQVATLYKNNRWYLVSNQRQILNELYAEHGIIQTMIDLPVDDGLRGGLDIKTEQLDPQQVKYLISFMEQEDDYASMAQSLKWNRLFGGAGDLIITGQNPASPLNLNRINKNEILSFKDADMWELFWSSQDVEAYNPELSSYNYTFYDYYGVKIHKSRVLLLKGVKAPSFIRPRLRGWGMSVLEAVVRGFNQYLKATDLIFEVLDEFKVDAYKIKNLANSLMTPQGQAKIQARISIANQQKSFQKAIVMDSEDDFIQKVLSFSGISDVMLQIRMQVASELRMPITKLFGVSSSSASGGSMGNSSQDDLENYNAMVESTIRQKSKYQLLKMVQLRSQQQFEIIPEDLDIGFKPLRVLSAKEEEEVKTSQFARVAMARQQGEITSKEFRDCVNVDGLLPIPLDVTEAALLEIEAEQEAKAEDAKDESGGDKNEKGS